MEPDFLSHLTGKVEIRRALRRRLAELDPAFHAEASLVICDLAAQLPAFRNAHCLALFAPLATEPDLRPLIEEAWAQGKQVALPRMEKDGTTPRLHWHIVKSWDDVPEPGPFGLREPLNILPLIEPARLECVFVPGLAFDAIGLRLGRGGGYYDWFLRGVPPALPRFGLMFTCQRVAHLPREPHDQALPAVITEDGLVSFAA